MRILFLALFLCPFFVFSGDVMQLFIDTQNPDRPIQSCAYDSEERMSACRSYIAPFVDDPLTCKIFPDEFNTTPEQCVGTLCVYNTSSKTTSVCNKVFGIPNPECSEGLRQYSTDETFCIDDEKLSQFIASEIPLDWDKKYTKNEGDPPNDCWPHPGDSDISVGVSTYSQSGVDYYVPDLDQTSVCNGSNIPPNDDIAGNVAPPDSGECQDYYDGQLCADSPATCEENGGCDSCGYVGFGDGGMSTASYVCLRNSDDTSTDTGTETSTDSGTETSTDTGTDDGTDTGTDDGTSVGSGDGTSVVIGEDGSGNVTVDVDVDIDTSGIQNKLNTGNAIASENGKKLDDVNGSLDSLNMNLAGIAANVSAIEKAVTGPAGTMPTITKSDFDNAKSYYTSEYENGIDGIYSDFQTKLATTDLLKTLDNATALNIGSGCAPDFSFEVDFGSVQVGDYSVDLSYGHHDITDIWPTWLWTVIYSLTQILAVYGARKIILGG